MAWFKSVEWQDALEKVETWWHDATDFIESRYEADLSDAFRASIFPLTEAVEPLAPDMDVSPLWVLHKAIGRIIESEIPSPLDNAYPIPPDWRLFELRDAAHYVEDRLWRAGTTAVPPTDEDGRITLIANRRFKTPPCRQCGHKARTEKKGNVRYHYCLSDSCGKSWKTFTG